MINRSSYTARQIRDMVNAASAQGTPMFSDWRGNLHETAKGEVTPDIAEVDLTRRTGLAVGFARSTYPLADFVRANFPGVCVSEIALLDQFRPEIEGAYTTLPILRQLRELTNQGLSKQDLRDLIDQL